MLEYSGKLLCAYRILNNAISPQKMMDPHLHEPDTVTSQWKIRGT